MAWDPKSRKMLEALISRAWEVYDGDLSIEQPIQEIDIEQELEKIFGKYLRKSCIEDLLFRTLSLNYQGIPFPEQIQKSIEKAEKILSAETLKEKYQILEEPCPFCEGRAARQENKYPCSGCVANPFCKEIEEKLYKQEPSEDEFNEEIKNLRNRFERLLWLVSNHPEDIEAWYLGRGSISEISFTLPQKIRKEVYDFPRSCPFASQAASSFEGEVRSSIEAARKDVAVTRHFQRAIYEGFLREVLSWKKYLIRGSNYNPCCGCSRSAGDYCIVDERLELYLVEEFWGRGWSGLEPKYWRAQILKLDEEGKLICSLRDEEAVCNSCLRKVGSFCRRK